METMDLDEFLDWEVALFGLGFWSFWKVGVLEFWPSLGKVGAGKN